MFFMMEKLVAPKRTNSADFCEHLNEVNIKLQGSDKTLDVMFAYIKVSGKNNRCLYL